MKPDRQIAPLGNGLSVLPAQLCEPIRAAMQEWYGALLKEGAGAVQDLAWQPKHLGAEVGVTAVLQIWTRDLRYHPHVHLLVPGGGLTADGLREVVKHVRAVSQRFEWVVVEGAGGLLSPLGEDFDSRDLIMELRALPLIVCPNRLGTVNQARLVLDALPVRARPQARVVLMSPRKMDAATRGNARLLAGFFAADRICEFPWLGKEFQSSTHLRPRPAKQVARVLGRWFSQ